MTIVNIGAQANDASGDFLRTAFDKLNKASTRVSVLRFGVTSSGVDSSAAMQGAIDSGEPLFVPPGDYLWGDLVPADITQIQGAGSEFVNVKISPAADNLFEYFGTDRHHLFALSGMTIDEEGEAPHGRLGRGSNSNYNYATMRLQNTYPLFFEDVVWRDVIWQILHLNITETHFGEEVHHGFFMNRCKASHALSLYESTTHGPDGGFFNFDRGINDGYVARTELKNISTTGFRIMRGIRADANQVPVCRWTFESCDFRRFYKTEASPDVAAIYYRGRDLWVRECHLEDGSRACIDVQRHTRVEGEVSDVPVTAENINIFNNVFRHTADHPNNAGMLHLRNVNARVEGNDFYSEKSIDAIISKWGGAFYLHDNKLNRPVLVSAITASYSSPCTVVSIQKNEWSAAGGVEISVSDDGEAIDLLVDTVYFRDNWRASSINLTMSYLDGGANLTEPQIINHLYTSGNPRLSISYDNASVGTTTST